MRPEDLEKLKKLLGEEFRLEELERISDEDPQLAGNAEHLTSLFEKTRQEPIPPPSPQFIQAVMARIEQPKGWLPQLRENFFTWRKLSLAGACAAMLIFGFYLASPYFLSYPSSGLTIQEKASTSQGKIYQVHFAFKQSGVHAVSVAGDFNQWNPQPLKKGRGGIYSVDLKIPEGTYAYTFLIDGKKWVVDPHAHRIVQDGFGNANSLINL